MLPLNQETYCNMSFSALSSRKRAGNIVWRPEDVFAGAAELEGAAELAMLFGRELWQHRIASEKQNRNRVGLKKSG